MRHLSPRQLAGLCYQTLSLEASSHAAAHLAWCAACRAKVEALQHRLARLSAPPPPFTDSLRRELIAAAKEGRAQQRFGPRMMRLLGLRPGLPLRSLRLLLGGLAGILFLAAVSSSLWSWHLDAQVVRGSLRLLSSPSAAPGEEVLVSALAEGDDIADREVRFLLWDFQRGTSLAEARVVTDARGLAQARLLVPQELPQREVWLRAEASLGGQAREARAVLKVSEQLRLHLSSDKPTYQPGQTMQLRALALHASGRPAAGRPATFSVSDADGQQIALAETTISAQGIASAAVELSADAMLGEYSLSVDVAAQSHSQSVLVDRYTLPPFAVRVVPQASSVDRRSRFEVEVRADFSFGAVVPRGVATLDAEFPAGASASLQAPLVDGVARFSLETPAELADVAVDLGEYIELQASVTDAAGRTEEGHGTLALTPDALLLDLRSQARTLRYRLPRPNVMLVRASRPDGTPVPGLTVRVLYSDAANDLTGFGETALSVTTGPEGIGSFELPPAYVGRPLALRAADPVDGKEYLRKFLASTVLEGSSVLSCDKALLRAGESLRCEIFNALDGPAMVRVHDADRLLTVESVPRGISTVTLPLPRSAVGLVKISVDGALTNDDLTVLVSPPEGLRVSLSGDTTRAPGEELSLSLRVTDDQGRPRVAAVGVAMVDAAVFVRAHGETPREALWSMFLPHHPYSYSLSTERELEALAPFLFPSASPGTAGGQGNWTAQQQAEARWLLSVAQIETRPLGQGDSLAADRQALAEAQRGAATIAEVFLTMLASLVLGLVVLFGLLRSFWARSLLGAVVLGLLVSFLVALALDKGFDVSRRESAEAGLLLGLLWVVAFLVWCVAQRPRSSVSAREAAPFLMAVGAAGFLCLLVLFSWRGTPLVMDDHETKFVSQIYKMPPPPPPPDCTPYPLPGCVPGGIPGGVLSADLVRDTFPETLYYHPGLITGEDGQATLQLTLADSITTWTLYAMASDASGALGVLEGGVEVVQDLFVELDAPRDLTVGDALSLQVSLHNYTDKPALVQLRAEADAGVRLGAGALAPVAVPAHGAAGLRLPITAVASGAHSITLYANTNSAADAVRREIEIAPAGREVRYTASGVVIDSVERSLALPTTALAEGRRVTLTLLGSPFADVLDSLERAVDEPHGSFEQMLSLAYPNALLLKALRASGRSDPAMEGRTLRRLQLGYQPLASYFSAHGFSFFGEDETDPGLSAYGLLALHEMSAFVDVDEQLLANTRDVLIQEQSPSGGFGGPALSAYVTWALVASDPRWADQEDPRQPWTPTVREARAATTRAVEALALSFTSPKGLDTYSLALAANVFLAAGPSQRGHVAPLLDEIWARATVQPGDIPVIHFSSRSGTIFGASGAAEEAEILALFAFASLESGQPASRVRDAYRALLSQRDPVRGHFYTAHGTALALRALLAANDRQAAQGRALILVDDKEVGAIAFTPENANLPQTLDLTPFVSARSRITISAKDGAPLASELSYRLAVRYYTPWETPPMAPLTIIGESDPTLSLSAAFSQPSFRLGEEGSLVLTLTRAGGAITRGPIVVEVGLPPGFRARGDFETLEESEEEESEEEQEEANKKAEEEGSQACDDKCSPPKAETTKDDQKKVEPKLPAAAISLSEPRPRGLALYLDDPGAGTSQTITVPVVAVRNVTRVQTPPQRAYFLSLPWIEAVAAPLSVLVTR